MGSVSPFIHGPLLILKSLTGTMIGIKDRSVPKAELVDGVEKQSKSDPVPFHTVTDAETSHAVTLGRGTIAFWPIKESSPETHL
jgi:hypothetical protein